MNENLYSYHWSIKLFKYFFIVLGVGSFVNALFMISVFPKIAAKPEYVYLPSVLVLLFAFVMFGLCASVVNIYPEIVVTRDTIVIKYFLNSAQVKLDEIVGVKNSVFPLLSKKKWKFVFTKKFPFPHRLGSIFHGTLKPGFMINPALKNFDQLLSDIESRIAANSVS